MPVYNKDFIAAQAAISLVRASGVDVVIDENIFNALLKADKTSLQKMTMYHGSPYSFDKFSLKHYGKGEGAAAHGYGVYVAATKATAQNYALKKHCISYRGEIVDIDEKLDGKDHPIVAAYDALCTTGSKNKAVVYIKRLEQLSSTSEMKSHWRNIADLLKKSTKADFKQIGLVYEVEIPEDNGLNYLQEESPVPEALWGSFLNHFRGENRKWAGKVQSEAKNDPEYVVRDFVRLLGLAMDGRPAGKKASALLSKWGYAGIMYDGRSDGRGAVIFRDEDVKIVSKVQRMARKGGEVYGFVKDGKVFLNPDAIVAEAPLHEYTHLWDRMIMRADPTLWSKGVEILKKSSVWNEVANDPNYADIAGDENMLASEVHARLAGRCGAARLELLAAEIQPLAAGGEASTLVEAFRNWVGRFWNALGTALDGILRKTGEYPRNALEFATMPLADLAKGVNPAETLRKFEQAEMLYRQGFDQGEYCVDDEIRIDEIKTFDEITKDLSKNDLEAIGLDEEVLRNIAETGLISVYGEEELNVGMLVSRGMGPKEKLNSELDGLRIHTVHTKDIAWIDPCEGVYAPVDADMDNHGIEFFFKNEVEEDIKECSVVYPNGDEYEMLIDNDKTMHLCYRDRAGCLVAAMSRPYDDSISKIDNFEALADEFLYENPCLTEDWQEDDHRDLKL